MTWTAPDVERPRQPYVADERLRLDSWLDFQRAALLHKCAGLTSSQLAQRPVATSELSLLGLVRHMAANERIWFRIRFARSGVEDLYAAPGYPDAPSSRSLLPTAPRPTWRPTSPRSSRRGSSSPADRWTRCSATRP